MNTVFNIQKFCTNDGPGIRTTVFLKGCPLDCLWCHNPESKRTAPEIMYNERLCIGCGLCEKQCENACHTLSENSHSYNRNGCTACGKCAEVCPAKAVEIAGNELCADDIIKEVLRDEAFYKTSGGGITLSGGEPMLQFAFTLEILEKAKEKGLHTCMETSGFAPKEHFERVAPFVDIFLYDYKLSDENEHIKYTGVSNKKILENLFHLDSLGKSIILRCPVIPGINDTAAHFEAISAVANKLSNIIEINVEPYHPLGSSKAKQLGLEYKLGNISFPDSATVEKWMEKIASLTAVPVKKA